MSSLSVNRRDFLAATLSAAALGTQAWADSPKTKSLKKGFCTVTGKNNDWLKRINQLNVNWFYSWGANKPENVPENVEFCPMLWGGHKSWVKKQCERVEKLVAEKRVQKVMGFNEPDQHDQSDLTVEQVLEMWPWLMELNVPLVSPGCVHPDRDWMKEFMAEVDRLNYRVDYISVHSYAGPSVNGLMNKLEGVYKMFGRPVWITEIAVGDWKAKKLEQNSHSPEKIARFMQQLLPELEKAKFVDRYAWYSAKQSNPHLGTSALFDDDGNLTPLGEIYGKHSAA